MPKKTRKIIGEKKEHPVTTVELPALFEWMRSILVSGKPYNCNFQPSRSWNGNMSFSQALDCAENGWQDAPAIRHVTLPDVAGFVEDVTYYQDVTGEILDIGAYCAGVPEHFYMPNLENVPVDRIIKLSIEVGAPAVISPESLRNRGEAIIA